MRNVYLSTSEEAALGVLGTALTRMGAIQARWGQPGERARPSIEEIRREKQIILGSGEQIAESFVELHRDLGVECLFLTCYLPGMDPEASLDMVSALGAETLPLVRREVGTASLFAASGGAPGGSV
jgi:hypothetical protein